MKLDEEYFILREVLADAIAEDRLDREYVEQVLRAVRDAGLNVEPSSADTPPDHPGGGG